MKKEDIRIFIYRFNVLYDKITFGITLNDLDKRLMDILEEYDMYIDKIKEEIRKKNDK